jgi:hypothetical protein
MPEPRAKILIDENRDGTRTIRTVDPENGREAAPPVTVRKGEEEKTVKHIKECFDRGRIKNDVR